jgi:hypothetical protein
MIECCLLTAHLCSRHHNMHWALFMNETWQAYSHHRALGCDVTYCTRSIPPTLSGTDGECSGWLVACLTYCLTLQASAVHSSEMLASFYSTLYTLRTSHETLPACGDVLCAHHCHRSQWVVIDDYKGLMKVRVREVLAPASRHSPWTAPGVTRNEAQPFAQHLTFSAAPKIFQRRCSHLLCSLLYIVTLYCTAACVELLALCCCISCHRPSGTESETEEEVLAAVKHLVAPNSQIFLDDFLKEWVVFWRCRLQRECVGLPLQCRHP